MFTYALFGIQLPGSHEEHAQVGVMLVTKFGRTLGTTIVCVFCRLCTNHSGYKLRRHRSRSTLDSSLILSKAMFEEIFSGPTPVFVSSFVPELFTCLFQSYSHVYWGILNEQTIVSMVIILSMQTS